MFSAEYETALNNPEELLGKGSAIGTVVEEMRLVLSLISFFTCGEMEARQWTIRKGSTAPEAAGLIHTDLQKHLSTLLYIRDDLKQLDTFDESKLKSQGKQHKCGKSI